MEAAEEILPNRRPSTIESFERLKQVAEALEAVWEDFSSEISRGEKSHQCDISPALNTSIENISKTCTTAKQRSRQPIRTRPAQVALLANVPLREIIEYYWNTLDNRGALSPQTIQMAVKERAHQPGVKSSVWKRHCKELGQERTALCLIIANRNSEPVDGYRVRKTATAAFIGMARSEARQGAVVNSLLGELIGTTEGQRYVASKGTRFTNGPLSNIRLRAQYMAGADWGCSRRWRLRSHWDRRRSRLAGSRGAAPWPTCCLQHNSRSILCFFSNLGAVMSDPKFMHLQSNSRKANKRGQSVEQVLAEASRAPKYSKHVADPRPPSLVYGVAANEVRWLNDEVVATGGVEVTLKDGRIARRSIRKDRHTLTTAVASHPLPTDLVSTKPDARADYERWRDHNPAWLKARFGDNLVSVIEHWDEKHPHIHAYILPLDDPTCSAR
ncbi:hypothetical protein [Litoreibacter halocynthiae]|uniref:hypothetical protein n=1 Tax=Litoreibacter halocynthiae TaxID=1242689 RepID=UPI0024926724|nr:hypothetical protein [Litoreibacter halocynthiae]